MRKIRLAQLYPEELNLYGDRGNVLCLKRRLEARGLAVEYRGYGLGERLNDFDILLIGGGQDKEMKILARDLKRKSEALCYAVRAGRVIFGVCGGYQLLGEGYRTQDGEELKLSGALPFYTEAGAKRRIGNIIFDTPFGRVVGFENHGGLTYLGDLQPLGRVVTGFGNNGEGGEGLLFMNTFGTYAHGPVLPKNPALADALIKRAVGCEALAPMDDELEMRCHNSLIRRFR